MSFRVALITDVHANFPALQAALEHIQQREHDLIYHLGDAIGIGPQPAECLDLLLATPNVRCLMGNHDASFVTGLSAADAPDSKEAEHTRWTHAQLSPALHEVVARWPYRLNSTFEGVRVACTHYGLTSKGDAFATLRQNPSSAELDTLFQGIPAHLIAFGHDHQAQVVTGQACYVNPGALGCAPSAVAQYVTATFWKGRHELQQQSVPYDDSSLYEAFEQRRVPARAFIYRAFFGGRFSTGVRF